MENSFSDLYVGAYFIYDERLYMVLNRCEDDALYKTGEHEYIINGFRVRHIIDFLGEL